MAGKPAAAGKSMIGEPAPVRIVIKKKGGHGAAHGGAWKVAYADFITALMALFLLLWLIGSASDEQKRAIAGYFRDDPVAMPGQPSPGTGLLDGQESMDVAAAARVDSIALEGAHMTLRKLFSSSGDFEAMADQVLVQVTAEGLQIDLVDKANNVLFDVGSSSIRPAAREVLVEIARVVSKLHNKLVIGGHTDSRPYSEGAAFSNWELSTDRASTARRILAEAGLPESHLALVAGYADTRPLLKDNPEAPANRRISLTLLRKKVSPAPGGRPGDRGAAPVGGPAANRGAAPAGPPAVHTDTVPALTPGIDPGISRHLGLGQDKQGRQADQNAVKPKEAQPAGNDHP